MTIAILKLEAGQTIARPLSRAGSVDEMVELVSTFAAGIAVEKTGVKGWTLKVAKINALAIEMAKDVAVGNVDSETPVLVVNTTKFYAFREA